MQAALNLYKDAEKLIKEKLNKLLSVILLRVIQFLQGLLIVDTQIGVLFGFIVRLHVVTQIKTIIIKN